MGKQEILPPLRTLPTKARETATPTIVPSRVQPGGIIDSTLMRWKANRHARTLTAVAGRTPAETDLFDAQTQLVEAYGGRQRAVARLQELPEIISNERAKRRVERAEALRQVEHRHELAEAQRMMEIAHAETTLVDAQQALGRNASMATRPMSLPGRRRTAR